MREYFGICQTVCGTLIAPGSVGVGGRNHINSNLYAYGANSPVCYTDPDRREHGMPYEVQLKQREYLVNQSISFEDYNHIQKCKAGTQQFQLLTQRPNHPQSCMYYSVINSFKMAGFKESKAFSNLADFVDSKMGALYVDVIKEVLGLDAVAYEIPAGIELDDLKEMVGDSPTLITFTQGDFWNNGNQNQDDRHGISFQGDEFFEPFLGQRKSNFNDILGSKSKDILNFNSNKGGYYFEIKNKD